jgi:hypothetical protein
MSTERITLSYEEWRHCITVDCRIQLTRDFLETRLKALSSTTNEGTRRFVSAWGEGHRVRILSYMQRALDGFTGLH